MSDLDDFDANAGMDEPDRSEPADMGGGESSGPQDLLNGPDDSAEQIDEPTGPRRLESVMTDDSITPLTATDGQVTLDKDDFDELVHKADADTRWSINESADPITLTTKAKRGSDTRDQDEVKVKCKGNNPEATAQKLAETLAALEAEGVADTLRETQPSGSE